MTTEFDLEYEEIKFNHEVRGTFGTFRTNKSIPVAYVLASLPIARINELHTASEALDPKLARFEDLIQRDIDYERVRDIANVYLEEGKDRVVFFPPLLASVVVFDDGSNGGGTGGIQELYRQVSGWKQDQGWLVKTWDDDRFQIRIPVAKHDTGFALSADNAAVSVHPYGAQLRWNSRHASIIVIDGQHRLAALKHLFNDAEKRSDVSAIELPVCIVFYPNAVKDDSKALSIRDSLRDMFVTINKEAKTVSGHFLYLLDDKSLASLAVRDMAQLWKDDASLAFSKLHLLEWNEREAQSADKRMRNYSVTTVSILAKAIARHLVSDSVRGLTASFLNLEEVKDKVELTDEDPSIDDISDREFTVAQHSTLLSQIAIHVTPGLDLLFSKSRPYAQHAERVGEAMTWLHLQVTQGTNGAKVFRDDVLAAFRRCTEQDSAAAHAIETEFEERAAPPETDEAFFSNVFQQGLIGAWGDAARASLKYEVPPTVVASSLVAALEVLCFDSKKSFFGRKMPYNLLALYRETGTTILNETARSQWTRLILASLLKAECIQAYRSELEIKLSIGKGESKAIAESLIGECQKAMSDFLDDLEAATQRDFEKYWIDKAITESQRVELEKLRDEFGGKSVQLKEYVRKHLTKPRIKKCASALKKVLEISDIES